MQTQPTSAPGDLFPDSEVVHQRTLRVLWASAVFSRGGISMVFAVAVLAIKDMLGDDRWAGLSTASTTVGSAIAAAVLGAFMARRSNRNLGLTGGFAMGAAGGTLAVLAIESDQLLLFLVSMLMIGVASGTANLSRYAAADLAPVERRGRDISTVVFASTFGAVLFPLAVGTVNSWAGDLGLKERSGTMAVGAILMALSALAVALFMRPDPLAVATGRGTTGAGTPTKGRAANFRTALPVIFDNRMALLAFVALIVSQAVMVMVMAMTPLHMEAHGHSDGVVGWVISAHTLGMFAFAPLAGWVSDRAGRIPTILIAGFTLALATMLTALAGDAPKLLMFPGLYLLGLGWSFGLVAGSALLTESIDEADRVSTQGAADMAMNLASGLGALASGLVVDMAGFHILSMIGMAGAALLMAHGWFERKLSNSAIL